MREPQFGVALENFTPAPAEPSIDKLIAYTAHAESLGFASVWAWDHILLGTKRPFPFLESLATLTALASTTTRVRLGIGVLVLPLRNPVVLAKELASLDQISKGRLVLGLAAGWYEREFQACAAPFAGRGKTFVQHLEILRRLWTEDQVDGIVGDYVFKQAVMRPRPYQRPHPPLLIGGYVDRVLRRVARHGDGWLTYFYTAETFRATWAKIRGFAEEQGRNPAGLRNVAQLPICVAGSYEEADRRVRDFIGRYFDVAPWSESTPDSAIRGTAAQCAEQLAAHLAAGVEHIVLIPSDYREDQLDAIARDILPRVRPGARRAGGA
jgi:probable F420-dependent oxidoreductase